MEKELPKTEQELNDYVEAKVQEKAAELEAKHNGQMANLRKKYDDDLKKAKEQAGLTAEQLAQEKVKEQYEADQKELNELRAYKKTSEISQKLAKEGLPSYFKNDTRLLNADSSELDRVIKDVKKEYEATLPKGATHSTVVQSAQGAKSSNDKTELYQEVGEAIKNALGQYLSQYSHYMKGV